MRETGRWPEAANFVPAIGGHYVKVKRKRERVELEQSRDREMRSIRRPRYPENRDAVVTRIYLGQPGPVDIDGPEPHLVLLRRSVEERQALPVG